MTRSGSVLPIPDPRPPQIQALIDLWPAWAAMGVLRSKWLGAVEDELQAMFPAASSRDRNLTARSLAPFPLAERDWL